LSDAASSSAQILSENDALKGGATPVQIKMDKIRAAKKVEEEWRTDAEQSLKAFETGKRRFNLWHSSILTLVSSLYNSTPIPDARRRYSAEVADVDESAIAQEMQQQIAMQAQQQPPPQMGDNGGPPMQPEQPDPGQTIQQAIDQAKEQAEEAAEKQDHQARKVADVYERGIAAQIDQYNFDAVMRRFVQCTRTTGRGVVRKKFLPEFGDVDPASGEAPLINATSRWENVPWKSYIRGPGLTRQEMEFEAFEHEMTKDQVKKLMEDGGTQPFRSDKDASGKPKERSIEERLAMLGFSSGRDQSRKKATKNDKGILLTTTVYEFHDKIDRKVCFFSPSDTLEYLKEIDDPMGLDGFFSTVVLHETEREDDTLTPICSYQVYKPQLDEVEDITKRIQTVVRVLKLRGFQNGKMTKDFEQLAEVEDGVFLPLQVPDQQFLDKAPQGLDAAIWVMPLADGINLLRELFESREQAKQAFYELSGISDIMRGATDPNETMGAQALKATFGSMRLQMGQRGVQIAARDMFRIDAEIMGSMFPVETLQRLSGITITPEIEQQIRDPDFELRVDIETDSTIMADRAKHLQDTALFMQGAAQFINSIGTVTVADPALRGAFYKLLGANLKGYKVNRASEDALAELVEKASEPMEPPQDNSGPSPEQIAHEQQMQAQQAQMDAQKQAHEQQVMQLKMSEQQAKQQHDQMMGQIKQLEAQLKAQHDQTIAQNTSVQAQSQQQHDANQAEAQRQHDMAIASREHGVAAGAQQHEQLVKTVDAQVQGQQMQTDTQVAMLNARVAHMKAQTDLKKAHLAVAAAKAKPKPTMTKAKTR
jgi:hypothetical protein